MARILLPLRRQPEGVFAIIVKCSLFIAYVKNLVASPMRGSNNTIFFHIKPLFCEWRYLLSSIGIVTYSFGELAQFGRASDSKQIGRAHV